MPSIINAALSGGLISTGDTSGQLQLQTAGTTALTVDSSQNVGLGVTPNAWNADYKAFNYGSAGLIYGRSGSQEVAFGTNWYRNTSGTFLYTATNFASYYAQSSGVHYWFIAPSGTAGTTATFTQAMTLDASGNLLVGDTSNAGGNRALFYKTGANSIRVGSNTNASFRGYEFGASASDSITYGSIKMELNGGQLQIASGYSGFGGYTTFYINGSEGMRLASDASLLVGTTTSGGWQGNARGEFYSTGGGGFGGAGGVALSVYQLGSSVVAQNIRVNATSTAFIQFQYNGATTVGSITTNGTTTSYNVTSDQRLKTNIIDAPDGNIDQIKIRSFDWKADNSHNTYGVIAQELFEVAPYAVHKPDDENQMMAVDYSKLVPMMIKEIQQLKAEVATLRGA
jgi:hypothetical protein